MFNCTISITKYQDAKPVYLLSTVSKSTPIGTGKRTQRNEQVVKPIVVQCYNTIEKIHLLLTLIFISISTGKHK